jgi:hypothetical protein
MTRNPRSEIRGPKEDRNPKAEDGSAVLNFAARRPFGFRFSVFGFPSAFGFRFSDLPPSGGA